MDSQCDMPATVASTNNNPAAIPSMPEGTSRPTTPSNASPARQHTDPFNAYIAVHTLYTPPGQSLPSSCMAYCAGQSPLPSANEVEQQRQPWCHIPQRSDYRQSLYPSYESLNDAAQSSVPQLAHGNYHGNYPFQDTLAHIRPVVNSFGATSPYIPHGIIAPIASDALFPLLTASGPGGVVADYDSASNSVTTALTGARSTAGLGASSDPIHSIKRVHCVLPAVLAEYFQPTISVTASGNVFGCRSPDTKSKEMERLQYVCTQCSQSVHKAERASHYLGHYNLKEWACTW
jgi:hypothetical protein